MRPNFNNILQKMLPKAFILVLLVAAALQGSRASYWVEYRYNTSSCETASFYETSAKKANVCGAGLLGGTSMLQNCPNLTQTEYNNQDCSGSPTTTSPYGSCMSSTSPVAYPVQVQVSCSDSPIPTSNNVNYIYAYWRGSATCGGGADPLTADEVTATKTGSCVKVSDTSSVFFGCDGAGVPYSISCSASTTCVCDTPPVYPSTFLQR
jgi:hypothetical protein